MKEKRHQAYRPLDNKDHKNWMTLFLQTILINPLDSFRAAQRGEISSVAPYVILFVQVLVMPVLLILSYMLGWRIVISSIAKSLTSFL